MVVTIKKQLNEEAKACKKPNKQASKRFCQFREFPLLRLLVLNEDF